MKKIKIIFGLLSILTIGDAFSGIVYTDIADETLAIGGSIDIDFNGGGAEFTINDESFGGPVEPGIAFNTDAGFVMLGDFANGGWDEIVGLDLNTTIDASSNFANNGTDGYIDPFWATTMFTNVDTYIGATFKLGSDIHYGWILVNWDGSGTLIVKSFAYNDTPNEGILAGSVGSTAKLETNVSLSADVYPNPFNNQVTINAPIESNVSIIDLTGKIVMSIKLTESVNTIDVSELKVGIYFVQIELDSKIEIKKVVKK